jgi:cytochrome c-type biogenesis protein CcmF
MFILAFLVVVIGGSLRCSPGARPRSASAAASRCVSRANRLLLANNVLLVVACGAVLLGTLYPLLLDALGWARSRSARPTSNAVFVPLMAPRCAAQGPPASTGDGRHDGGPPGCGGVLHRCFDGQDL